MKYKSCHLIEHGMIFTWQNVITCCMYGANDGFDVLYGKYYASPLVTDSLVRRQVNQMHVSSCLRKSLHSIMDKIF